MSSWPPCIFSTCPPPPTKSHSPFQALFTVPSGSGALKLPLLYLRVHWGSLPSLPASPLCPCPVLSMPPPTSYSLCLGSVCGCEFYNCFFLSHLSGVHRQRSCCSEMWRQLLRDSETSVPGPRGKKGSEKGREEGEREGREGRERPDSSHKPRQQPQHQLSFWKKNSDSVNFLLSILPRIPFSGKRRRPARGPQDRKPPRMQPGQPGTMEEKPGEENS